MGITPEPSTKTSSGSHGHGLDHGVRWPWLYTVRRLVTPRLDHQNEVHLDR
ncbi:MAG: hypothetical protein M1294_11540 [Firmicutes bacterium]|jgi:hypothetical protein|nr:hypothetical protein [Bacillota bacterium]MCL5014256.1 hypothetical protein [Bacillota bacterium]